MLEKELMDIRRHHFNSRSRNEKQEWQKKEQGEKIAKELKQLKQPDKDVQKLIEWVHTIKTYLHLF